MKPQNAKAAGYGASRRPGRLAAGGGGKVIGSLGHARLSVPGVRPGGVFVAPRSAALPGTARRGTLPALAGQAPANWRVPYRLRLLF